MTCTATFDRHQGHVVLRIEPWDDAVASAARLAGGRWDKDAEGYAYPLLRFAINEARAHVLAVEGVRVAATERLVDWWAEQDTGERALDVAGLDAWTSHVQKRHDLVRSHVQRGPYLDAVASWMRTAAAERPGAPELYPYQAAGVAFLLARGGRGLIADEPGLGKTAQALAYLESAQSDPRRVPVLVVCPASVRVHWGREAARWAPSYTARVAVTGKDAPVKGVAGADVVVVSYQGLVAQDKAYKAVPWGTVIVDEAHRINNWGSAQSRVVRWLGSRALSFVALTGTPVVNKPLDVHAALRTIDKDMVPDRFDFRLRYCAPKMLTRRPSADGKGKGKGRGIWVDQGVTHVHRDELRALVGCLSLRRLKADVLPDLPAKRRQLIPVDVGSGQEDEILALVGESEATGAADQLRALVAMREDLGKRKAPMACEWIADFAQSGCPLIAFGHHRAVLDEVEEGIKAAGIPYVRVDGQTPGAKRSEAIDAFQDGKAQVFLGSTRACGEGITLTAASDVLFIERDWTAVAESQAEDRAHRIGQRESVTVWFLHAEGTLDEDLHAQVEAKRQLAADIVDPKMTDRMHQQAALEVLARMVRRLKANRA